MTSAPAPAPAPVYTDLLEPEPRLRVRSEGVLRALAFAFGGGGRQDELEFAMSKPTLEGSFWSADCFAEELFLGALVRNVLAADLSRRKTAVSAGALGYISAVLGAPRALPGGLTAVTFRQEIAREIAASGGRQEQLNALCDALHALFDLLEAGGVGVRLDPIRRRLDVLQGFSRVVELTADLGRGARSGLSRLTEFAATVRALPAYQRLVALLDHDGHLATVTVELRLGRDGDVREAQLVRVADNRANPFHVTPWRRFWTRLGCLLRGYRVSRDEVFGRVIADVFEDLGGCFLGLLQLLGDLELYRAGDRLRQLAEARGLQVCLPSFAFGEGRALSAVFNPFLLAEDKAPTPTELRSHSGRSIVIVTGPNSGGKTRLIQALGLSQVLAQAGLWIPAASAALPWHDGLFVSLGVATLVDQREGRLGTELLRIRRLFEGLEVGALVLVDELCSGTNPQEAEELFQMVLELLHDLSAQAFISTHFLQFARRLAQAPGVPGLEFLQVGLDAQHRPTYRFESGVAVTALAAQTASRLGVTRALLGELVEQAKERQSRRSSQGPHAQAPRA